MALAQQCNVGLIFATEPEANRVLLKGDTTACVINHDTNLSHGVGYCIVGLETMGDLLQYSQINVTTYAQFDYCLGYGRSRICRARYWGIHGAEPTSDSKCQYVLSESKS